MYLRIDQDQRVPALSSSRCTA